MASDVVALIKSDHRLMEALFERLKNRMEVLSAHGVMANSGTGDTEVSKLSRDELYQAAKEADIPRRSQMSKEELAEAVRKQG